jgi:hypothetical protein
LIKLVSIILVLLHLATCIWYYSARLEEFNPDTWVFRYGLMNESTGKLYLFGFYWAVTTLTTVGFGDFSGGTAAERIICILWMMIGVGFYSFTVGSIASILSSMDSKKKELEESLQDLTFYSKETGLP